MTQILVAARDITLAIFFLLEDILKFMAMIWNELILLLTFGAAVPAIVGMIITGVTLLASFLYLIGEFVERTKKGQSSFLQSTAAASGSSRVNGTSIELDLTMDEIDVLDEKAMVYWDAFGAMVVDEFQWTHTADKVFGCATDMRMISSRAQLPGYLHKHCISIKSLAEYRAETMPADPNDHSRCLVVGGVRPMTDKKHLVVFFIYEEHPGHIFKACTTSVRYYKGEFSKQCTHFVQPIELNPITGTFNLPSRRVICERLGSRAMKENGETE